MVVVIRVVYRHPALRSRKVKSHQRTVAFLLRVHQKIALAVYSQLQFMVRWAHPRLHPKVKDFLHFLVTSWAVHSEASAYLILAACQSWQFYSLVFPKTFLTWGRPANLEKKGSPSPE